MVADYFSTSVTKLGKVRVIGPDHGLVELYSSMREAVELVLAEVALEGIRTLQHHISQPRVGETEWVTSARSVGAASSRDYGAICYRSSHYRVFIDARPEGRIVSILGTRPL